MDEIKKLKNMLDGKAPVDLAPNTVVHEKIVYKDGENKENTT